MNSHEFTVNSLSALGQAIGKSIQLSTPPPSGSQLGQSAVVIRNQTSLTRSAVLHWTIGPLELQLNNWVNHEPWTDPFVPVRFSQFRPSLQCLPWNWFEATPGSGEALQKGQVFWAFPWRGHGGDFPISVRWQPEMASCLPANLTPWMCWKRTCRLGRFSLGWDKCELFCHVLPWFARSSVITQHK